MPVSVGGTRLFAQSNAFKSVDFGFQDLEPRLAKAPIIQGPLLAPPFQRACKSTTTGQTPSFFCPVSTVVRAIHCPGLLAKAQGTESQPQATARSELASP
jgi:hypothetical protein